MSAANHAVFLSYAREDATAARRIAEALRASGLEVWFDENELRGGDAWDAKIRRQISDCALFLPVISQHTQERGKGYFRLEWKLAVEQTHLMAEGLTFLAPIVVDDTREGGSLVPAEFMKVQWTRLPGALPTPAFVEQIRRLLAGPGPVAGRDFHLPPLGTKAGIGDPARQKKNPPGWTLGAGFAVVVGIATALYVSRKSNAPTSIPPSVPAATSPSLSLSPAPSLPAPLSDKSIAVLPFANMSAEKDNEFFVDGMHDEVITALAKIHDLKVISRTSVMAYKNPEGRNLKRIAGELGVATILEGSVQRAGNKVHLNAQLIDARTDEHLWADTFNGDASDIFALQASLAQKIAAALKATLTPDEKSLMERRPTDNQEAYNLFLRARALQEEAGENGAIGDYERIVGLYEQAVAKDPSFGLAQSQVALVHSLMYWFGFLDPTPARAEKMKAAVDAAVRLAPDAPETHLAVGAYHYRVERDWRKALGEFHIAEAGLPNDAQLFFWLAIAHRRLGDWTESLGYFERSVALNPRDLAPVSNWVGYLADLRRWEDVRRANIRYLPYFPENSGMLRSRADAEFALEGNVAAFARALVALPRDATDPDGAVHILEADLLRHDYAEADQALANLPHSTMPEGSNNIINNPTVLFRAYLAYLRGDREAARRFADEAIGYFRAGTWTARQVPWARMRIAMAEAWSNREAEAVADARAAMDDASAHDVYDASNLRSLQGAVDIVVGRRDDAIACLRQMMSGPCGRSPNDLRADPTWSRLKDDPRFEEILKSARPL
ncbi:MAG TPA: TIR domain-containing protein [Candidatus Didemnitutus sp.]|jgi:TolB-like protein